MLSSAYFVVWMTRKNGIFNAPPFDACPEFNTLLSGLSCEDTDIASWHFGNSVTASKGVWNPTTVYTTGDTVESAAYRMVTPSGAINIPIVYRSRVPANKGNSPEAFDGNWTCKTQPTIMANSDGGSGQSFPVCPFAYALHPLPLQSDLAGATWWAQLWHSLFGLIPAPGHVVQLIDIYVKLNYLLGSSIVSTISRPLVSTIGGASYQGINGLVVNKGINAQFQTWKTCGLCDFANETLSGFDMSAYVSGFQPGATVGAAYLSALSATGGTPPYIYAIIAGSLPAGVTLNGSTGVISGTPTEAGVFDFTAQVTDSTGATATTSCAAPMQCGGGSAKGNAFY